MVDRRTRLTELSDLPNLTDEEIARLEAENGLLQFDRMLELIGEAIASPGSFRLTTGIVTEMQRIAVQGLEPSAGTFRTAPVSIDGALHTPPEAPEIPQLVAEFCEYVNEHWTDASPLHLAAYAMWRLNWIHPFTNGNGRTSRVVSYLLLSAKLGVVLPGAPTIPEMIASDKTPYYEALEEADAADIGGRVDVGALERLLEEYLAAQLLSVIERAGNQ